MKEAESLNKHSAGIYSGSSAVSIIINDLNARIESILIYSENTEVKEVANTLED